MKASQMQVISAADDDLRKVDLPSYSEVVEMLRAAENKFSAMSKYHSGPSLQAIDGFRERINDMLVRAAAL